MGKTITPKYRVDFQRKSNWLVFSSWNSKQAGKPSVENLIKFREKYNASLKKGGCNEHIGIAGMVGNLRIVDQKLNFTLVKITGPLFEAF